MEGEKEGTYMPQTNLEASNKAIIDSWVLDMPNLVEGKILSNPEL